MGIARLCELLTKELQHIFYRITYFQVVPYKSIKNMLCPSNYSIRTSEQFTPRSKVRTPTKIASLNSISKMIDTYNVFCTFQAKEFLMCILKYSLKSPKSSKNLCILETMLCQQNQSKLKYFMCNYDKDLKYIFNMI